MKFPEMHGIIDRRLLVNFRADPEVVRKMLPAKFKPQLVGGYAMVGICLIRLAQIRPRFVPSNFGFSSENAAHRFAVEWERPQGLQRGVFVHRRDTSHRLSALVGGRLFPGIHHHAKFEVSEGDGEYSVSIKSFDDDVEVCVKGKKGRSLPQSSIFANIEEASEFFKEGSKGYSPARSNGQFEGLQLITQDWSVMPFDIENVYSSYFSDKEKFPEGSIALDHALLMLDLKHSWRTLGLFPALG